MHNFFFWSKQHILLIHVRFQSLNGRYFRKLQILIFLNQLLILDNIVCLYIDGLF